MRENTKQTSSEIHKAFKSFNATLSELYGRPVGVVSARILFRDVDGHGKRYILHFDGQLTPAKRTNNMEPLISHETYQDVHDETGD